VSRALVVMPDASAIEVRCGDRTQGGTTSARITDFPAGTCTVRVNYLGDSLSADVFVERAATVTCAAAGGQLSCTPDP
jgi:hypothetical protein